MDYEIVHSHHSMHTQQVTSDTALEDAIKAGDLYAVSSLIHANTDGITLLAHRSDARKLNEYNCHGDTALTYASRKGQLAICEILIQTGACVNKSTHHVRQTPLLIALEAGFRDVVHCLLDAGADVQLIDNIGMSPLYIAVKNRDTDIVSRLIKCGCDVNYGSQDHAPIFLAARKDLLEIIQLLCEAGCDKNLSNKYGVTPIYEAALKGNSSVLKYLVSVGCDLNKPDMYNVSPLHIAAMNGHREATDILINGGANVKLRDDTGRNALHLAVEMGKSKVVQLFLEAGANIMHKPIGNQSLYSLSQMFQNGHKDTAEVLLRGCAKLPLPHYPGVTDMFLNNGRLMKMLLLSGNQTIPGSLTIAKLHPHVIKEEDLRNWLTERHGSPMSLKENCRIRIRRCLGNTILYGSNFLPIPSLLKDYILLNDL